MKTKGLIALLALSEQLDNYFAQSQNRADFLNFAKLFNPKSITLRDGQVLFLHTVRPYLTSPHTELVFGVMYDPLQSKNVALRRDRRCATNLEHLDHLAVSHTPYASSIPSIRSGNTVFTLTNQAFKEQDVDLAEAWQSYFRSKQYFII